MMTVTRSALNQLLRNKAGSQSSKPDSLGKDPTLANTGHVPNLTSTQDLMYSMYSYGNASRQREQSRGHFRKREKRADLGVLAIDRWLVNLWTVHDFCGGLNKCSEWWLHFLGVFILYILVFVLGWTSLCGGNPASHTKMLPGLQKKKLLI